MAEFNRDKGEKMQQEVRRNYQRTKCGAVWRSQVKRDGELVKFCNEIVSDEALKEAVANVKSCSSGEVEGCL